MWRTTKSPSYLLFFFVFIFLSCLGGSDDVEAEEEGIGELLREEFITGFTAETEVDGQLEFSAYTQPVVIMKGESVTFSNSSTIFQEYENGQETLDYIGTQSWTFEGGTPSESTEDLVTVTYNEPGKYDVTLVISGVQGPETLNVSEYVCVVEPEPEPEPVCYIETETTSDGRSTVFIYNDDNFLIRADKFFNGNLQEYSLYSYDDEDRIIEEIFNDAFDAYLGKIDITYNASNQIIQRTTEDANGTMLRQRSFIWDNTVGVTLSAQYIEPDGQGGQLTFEVGYTWDDDNKNIIEEAFALNNVYQGSNFYEFDETEKVFTGLNIQSAPLLFNQNNPTSITVKDANGTTVGSQSFSYLYNEGICGGRAVSSTTITEPGNIT
ncbi:MAG: PKD domain-containing protein, partial [Eudoraea sp.]|nr:PKD domain-containing protein [Eudoraea sp.]